MIPSASDSPLPCDVMLEYCGTLILRLTTLYLLLSSQKGCGSRYTSTSFIQWYLVRPAINLLTHCRQLRLDCRLFASSCFDCTAFENILWTIASHSSRQTLAPTVEQNLFVKWSIFVSHGLLSRLPLAALQSMTGLTAICRSRLTREKGFVLIGSRMGVSHLACFHEGERSSNHHASGDSPPKAFAGKTARYCELWCLGAFSTHLCQIRW